MRACFFIYAEGEETMVIIAKEGISDEKIREIITGLNRQGLTADVRKTADKTVIGIVGDTQAVDTEKMAALDYVEDVIAVKTPYKRASRAFHPENTIVHVDGVPVGGRKIAVIAGPCSIETADQITGVACDVRAAGAVMLRGGAFKPRTSPYAFQGLGDSGLDMLLAAGKKARLPVVTEIMSADKLDLFLKEDIDLIQVGARNMQNFDLLKALGRTNKPILLKRGLSATIEEWLMSAEYIMSEGNSNVILCERGIRTFETYTRNTLDLSAVLAVKKLSHLPVVVDPSHAAGKRWMVADLAKAAIAVGADGLMIEVHNDPDKALCDGAQSITPAVFEGLMKDLRNLAPLVGRAV